MNITIIGAGNSGLAMAAYLSLSGHTIALWNRSRKTIEQLIKTKTIHCHGIVQGDATLALVTTNLEEALADADLAIITTPANAHRGLAERFSRALKKELPVILAPGRTCGAIEFLHHYYLGDPSAAPVVAETQTALLTSRKDSPVDATIYAVKDGVYLASADPDFTSDMILDRLPSCLSNHLVAAQSMIQTSIGNVSVVLHCAPLLFNSGWTECQNSTYKYYYDGITPRIAKFIEKIDQERIRVSEALGHRVESTKAWLKRSYHSEGDTLYERLQNTASYHQIEAPSTMKHRYIYEDIPYGLVPIESLGRSHGIDMTYSSLTIDLASRLMNQNFRATGRNLKDIGFTGFSPKKQGRHHDD
ncbi:MAG: NAD(P)-binding domain-containing protein [Clostridiaceae bacterium]|nr:NAD(P)-binding domain-containing protein [Clostridiaceae bacterium]